MTNLLTRNYIFMIMIVLAVILTYCNKHGIVIVFFPFVILTLIYMLIHRVKFMFNKSVAILLLISLWSLISASWAVNPTKGISISILLFLYILSFQAIYWLSKYTPKYEANFKEHKHKIRIFSSLSALLDKRGHRGIDHMAYAIILVCILIIIDNMLSGKISVIIFHKPTTYKNQFWLEGIQTLSSGLIGGVGIVLYKRKKIKLVLSMIFIVFASIITNYFYTGYAGIIMAILAVIIIAILPRKISLWFFIIVLTLYYLLFPTVFGLLYHSPLMAKINAYSPESLLDRYVIWEYSHLLINKAWLFGHGAHSTRYITAIMSDKLIRPSVVPGVMTHYTHHPHNLASQIWIEYGLFGVLAYCLFLITLLKKIFSTKLPKYATILLMISLMMITTIQNTAWGMWEAWFIVSMSLSLGVANFAITYLEYEISKD